MEQNWLLLAAVPVTGFAAGFINTIAGSGSLITLPILILLGLPANVANGTNRVGVLLQNVVAVATLRNRGALPLRGSWAHVVPSVLGGLVGAELAVDLDETLMRRVIGVLMLVMIVVMLIDPDRWIRGRADQPRNRTWLHWPVMFAIGVYGGFIQAGVGIFLIAGLVLGSGYGLITANSLKNLIVLIFTAAALVVFVVNDQVSWGLGLLLAAGQGAGAWLGAHMAVKHGAPFLRWAVIVIVALSAVALLFDATGR